jgi:hypothetical protein
MSIGTASKINSAADARHLARRTIQNGVLRLSDGTWSGGLYPKGLGRVRLEVVDIGRSGSRLANLLGGGDYTSPPVAE